MLETGQKKYANKVTAGGGGSQANYLRGGGNKRVKTG